MARLRRATQQELEAAVTALRNGELVVFPTETVYGLGANARDPAALRRIFEVKGRPADHPLILHLDSARFLSRWVATVTPEAEKLAAAFWPGPLTLVMPRSEDASDVLTGGQDTVAIRIPSHPMAQQLLTAFGGGIAAPSANRFGKVSPTRPEHVREEFGEAVALILDGGECMIGIESSILSLAGPRPRLLRPGSITQAQIEAVIGPIDVGADASAPRVPGSTAQHYAPVTELALVPSTLLESRIDTLLRESKRVAVLAQRPPRKAQTGVTWINAGARLDTFQRDLYANLRLLDKAGADQILVEEVPAKPEWAGVQDRLARSATKPR